MQTPRSLLLPPLFGAAALLALTILGPAAQAQAGGQAKPARTKAAKKKPPAKTPAGRITGGANQVEGLNGKVGEMLFTGRWRFQVQEVNVTDAYTLKVPTSEQDYGKYSSVADYDANTRTFTPKEGYTFVAVRALVKNGQKTTQQLGCYLGDPKTAVADTKGGSYPPVAYDMLSQGAWVTKPLLPGAGQEMTVLFAVPKGTELKDLVFTLNNWSDMKGKEVRVSLTK
jgi:hypothetical protein